jgi:hypothetical protein
MATQVLLQGAPSIDALFPQLRKRQRAPFFGSFVGACPLPPLQATHTCELATELIFDIRPPGLIF